MNIALSAVTIFILLIPPVAFYLIFTATSNNAKAGAKLSLLDGVLATAVVSLFIHAIGIWLVSSEIRFDIILKVLGGELKDVERKISNEVFDLAVRQFAIYNFILVLVLSLLGLFVRRVVDEYGNPNGENEFTRLHNKWWYFFRGTAFGISDFDFVWVDAAVDTKDGTMIYSGILENYVCHGEILDRFYLRETTRREFKTLSKSGKLLNSTGDALSIPGHIFSIDYSNCINLNLTFIKLEENV